MEYNKPDVESRRFERLVVDSWGMAVDFIDFISIQPLKIVVFPLESSLKLMK